MQRREFITLVGGTAATWPLAARAQSQQRVRLIGVLAGTTESDPQAQRRVGAFTQALRDLGWSDGANIKLEKRYSAGIPGRLPALATELVQANCAVIVAEAAQAVDAARGATRTIPIVMVYSKRTLKAASPPHLHDGYGPSGNFRLAHLISESPPGHQEGRMRVQDEKTKAIDGALSRRLYWPKPEVLDGSWAPPGGKLAQ